VPDVLASTANLVNGWQAGAPFREGTANFEAKREWNRAVVYRKTIVLFAGWLQGEVRQRRKPHSYRSGDLANFSSFCSNGSKFENFSALQLATSLVKSALWASIKYFSSLEDWGIGRRPM
jgi:hypothetical protein